MRRLADLASGLVLSFFVRVGDYLRNKYNKKHSQAECKQPRKFPSPFRPVYHLLFESTPSLSWTLLLFPSEQYTSTRDSSQRNLRLPRGSSRFELAARRSSAFEFTRRASMVHNEVKEEHQDKDSSERDNDGGAGGRVHDHAQVTT